MDIHIALAAEHVGNLWGFPITNTLLMSVVVLFTLSISAIAMNRKLALVPGKTQTLVEFGIGGAFDYVKETLGNEKLARKIFPLLASLFLFILAGNILQFLPGVGTIGFFEQGVHGETFIPLFRSLNTDLNVTLALAAIAFIAIEWLGVATLGFLKYAHKFVTFKSPLAFAIGIIDLFSEIARLVSFSFRLFGNIFAGEVMIAIIAGFLPAVLPVPLMLFEVFVGFIQATIFPLLVLFFIKIAITEHH